MFKQKNQRPISLLNTEHQSSRKEQLPAPLAWIASVNVMTFKATELYPFEYGIVTEENLFPIPKVVGVCLSCTSILKTWIKVVS